MVSFRVFFCFVLFYFAKVFTVHIERIKILALRTNVHVFDIQDTHHWAFMLCNYNGEHAFSISAHSISQHFCTTTTKNPRKISDNIENLGKQNNMKFNNVHLYTLYPFSLNFISLFSSFSTSLLPFIIHDPLRSIEFDQKIRFLPFLPHEMIPFCCGFLSAALHL